MEQPLGQLTHLKIVEGMSDDSYHGESSHLSSSSLKKFLKDPSLAMHELLLKTTPFREDSETKKKNYRIGKAIHAYAFEGASVYKAKFPIFSGSRRSGKAWEDFCKENPDAAKEDTILSVAEAKEVEISGPEMANAYSLFTNNLEATGSNILKVMPEVSFFATYENGVSLKVRADALILCNSAQNPGQYYFFILDGKTTSASVSDFVRLAFAIDDFGYDLSARMYLNVIQSALSLASSWGQLIPELDVSAWPEYIGPQWGSFQILWGSKESSLQAYQEICSASSDLSGWTETGLVKFNAALKNYLWSLQGAQELLQKADAEQSLAVLKQPATIQVPLLKKNEYALRDIIEADRQLNWPHGGITLESVRTLQKTVSLKINPPPEPEQAKAPESAPAPKTSGLRMPAFGKLKLVEATAETETEEKKPDTSVKTNLTKGKINSMRKGEVVKYLTDFNIEFDANSNIRQLQTLLKEELFK